MPVTPLAAARRHPVLVAGRLNHVGITAHGIPADPADGRLPVTRLDLDLTGVRQSGDEQAARADSAKASAFLIPLHNIPQASTSTSSRRARAAWKPSSPATTSPFAPAHPPPAHDVARSSRPPGPSPTVPRPPKR
ncbi:hypothetical protein [Streptomyces lydicus]|uniref:hypothetical protein n=1 Tax=Streptomyces lydicus TaxID=47763 RepID=UPI0037D3EB2C